MVLLWGLCGWREGDRIVTTAEQAGTSALRPALEAMDYTFKYVYNVIDEPEPLEAIDTYIRAAFAAKRLRHARVGTMGYRDMLLYGTQYEGNSMRGQLGEVSHLKCWKWCGKRKRFPPRKLRKW